MKTKPTDDESLTGDDLKRISLLAGMKDRSLAEKAIAEEYTLEKLIQAGINRESSRANVEAMHTKPTETVSRMASSSGKYSVRHKPPASKAISKKRCDKCTYKHGEGRCPAEERKCNDCSETGHFAGSKLCKHPKTKPKNSKHTARRVEELSSSSEPESETSDEEHDRGVIARIERNWPGVESNAQAHKYVFKIQEKTGKTRQSKRVKMKVGGKRMKLYCDTGSPLTIIPPELYSEKMGKVVAADTHLRAWGSKTRLDTKGRVKTTLNRRNVG